MVQHGCEVDLDSTETESYADDGTSAFHLPFIHYTWWFCGGSIVRVFQCRDQWEERGWVSTPGGRMHLVLYVNEIDRGCPPGLQRAGINVSHTPIKRPSQRRTIKDVPAFIRLPSSSLSLQPFFFSPCLFSIPTPTCHHLAILIWCYAGSDCIFSLLLKDAKPESH